MNTFSGSAIMKNYSVIPPCEAAVLNARAMPIPDEISHTLFTSHCVVKNYREAKFQQLLAQLFFCGKGVTQFFWNLLKLNVLHGFVYLASTQQKGIIGMYMYLCIKDAYQYYQSFMILVEFTWDRLDLQLNSTQSHHILIHGMQSNNDIIGNVTEWSGLYKCGVCAHHEENHLNNFHDRCFSVYSIINRNSQMNVIMLCWTVQTRNNTRTFKLVCNMEHWTLVVHWIRIVIDLTSVCFGY